MNDIVGNDQNSTSQGGISRGANEWGGLAITIESRDWYRDQYSRLTKIAVVSGIVAGLSVTGNILQFVLKPQPVYFALSADNRLMPMVPLSAPFITEEALMSWTVETVLKTLSLNFTDWKRELTEVQSRYTDTAFSEFVKSLRAAGTVELIETKRLSMTAVNKAAPIIVAKGPNQKGVYAWRISFPLLISYESSQGVSNTQNLEAYVTIERVSTLKNSAGVQISQLLLKLGKTNH
jgi:intracellular multiplication protein IcmL